MSLSVTIEEIARLADVSRSTVSRVLNNHPNVRAEVREKVLRVVQEHNYTPNAAARSLASSRSNVVSLVVPRSAATLFADPFFPLVIQGISEACTSAGYFLMLSMLSAELERPFYNRVLRGRHFDGVIMLSSDVDDPLLPQLIRDQMPLVLVGRHPYLDEVATVDVENREGARLATAHLIRLGYRRIATITGPQNMAAGIDRRDGYKQALTAAGIVIDPALVVEGDFTQESGYSGMGRLLALPDRPRAVFAASDTMAFGAMRAISEAGLRMPEQVALVGFDDVPAAAYSSPPLSTIHQPCVELGAAAVRALVAQIDTPAAPQAAVRLPTALVVRGTCGGSVQSALRGTDAAVDQPPHSPALGEGARG
jgi:LacI family transcriptional regulator